MDHHRNSCNLVAARLFRPEYQYKDPAHRQLDPYPDCDRRHSRHIKSASRDLKPTCVAGKPKPVDINFLSNSNERKLHKSRSYDSRS